MSLREIIAHLGFTFDSGKADEADRKLGHIKQHAVEATGGVDGLLEAFRVVASVEVLRWSKELVEGLSEQAVQIGHTAEATGLATDDLQAYQFGAKQAGVESEQFSLALRRLSTAIAGGKDELGSQGPLLAKLGIHTGHAKDAVKDLGDALPKIADHFQQMQDGPAKAALAQELFGRQGARLIPILNRGAEGLAELRKEFKDLGGGFSPEAIERAEEFHHETVRLSAAFDSFKSQLAVSILPRVTAFVEQLTKGAIWIQDFAKNTTLLDGAVSSLATAIGVTLWGALSPFIGGALKFAAIYLAVDDLKGFLEGQDSEIGAILDSWFGDGTAEVVREWVLDAIEWFRSGFADMAAVLPVFTSAFSAEMASIAADFDGFVLGLEQKWNGLIDSLGLNDRFKIDTTSRVAELAKDSSRRDTAVAANSRAQDNLRQYIADTTPTAGATSQAFAPFAPQAQHAQQSWNMVTNAPQIQINVPPGTPAAQAKAIGEQTREAIRQSHRDALQALENRKG